MSTKKRDVQELLDVLRADSRSTSAGGGFDACVLAVKDADGFREFLAYSDPSGTFTIVPNGGNPMPEVTFRKLGNGSLLVEVRERKAI